MSVRSSIFVSSKIISSNSNNSSSSSRSNGSNSNGNSRQPVIGRNDERRERVNRKKKNEPHGKNENKGKSIWMCNLNMNMNMRIKRHSHSSVTRCDRVNRNGVCLSLRQSRTMIYLHDKSRLNPSSTKRFLLLLTISLIGFVIFMLDIEMILAILVKKMYLAKRPFQSTSKHLIPRDCYVANVQLSRDGRQQQHVAVYLTMSVVSRSWCTRLTKIIIKKIIITMIKRNWDQ